MICNKNDCTGCMACFNACPVNAIKMICDKYGNYYPNIDVNKCIKCKLCEKVCPAINRVKGKYPIECYAAKAKDDQDYQKASSGGIARVLYKYIINKGGIGYGVGSDKKDKIAYKRIDNMDKISNISGSKYVYSYAGDIYKKVKIDLDKNLLVLFVGLPCQIAALKNFLRKEYDNLILIDIICHGVPSLKLLEEDLKSNEINFNKIDYITFRNKGKMQILLNGKEFKKEIDFFEDIYFYSFLKGISYRENCYSCQYANNYRISDITLGDFWGLVDDVKFKHDKGINCVLINTIKGKKIFQEINECIEFEKRDIDMAIKGNAQLNNPTTKNKSHQKFLKNYLKYNSFKKSMYKTIGIRFEFNKTIKLIKRKIKSNDKLYEIIKKIIKKMKRR